MILHSEEGSGIQLNSTPQVNLKSNPPKSQSMNSIIFMLTKNEKNTHVIPIVQNVNKTIFIASELPLIDAFPVKVYAAAIVGDFGRTRTHKKEGR